MNVLQPVIKDKGPCLDNVLCGVIWPYLFVQTVASFSTFGSHSTSISIGILRMQELPSGITLNFLVLPIISSSCCNLAGRKKDWTHDIGEDDNQ